ncbi:MAG: cytochrome-c peroxidase, partial [Rhodospirillales bacterium]|nr:cytochrome-c peroxidase [Rhodospirillales bacterium]
MRIESLLIFAAAGLAGLLMAVGVLAEEPIKPIPETIDVNPWKVDLGRSLFHDPILSKDETIACASCHELASGGDDGLRVSIGIEGREGPINSPTVFNAAFNFKQFWDGRARDLEAQIDGPIQNPVEMGNLWPDVVSRLYQDSEYPAQFNEIYPDGINRKNIKNAI